MKIAYIMRGISGSGKSTLAKELAGKNGIIHSTDEYFYNQDGSKYMFNSEKLIEYHKRNQEAFCFSLANSVPVVICDNTNAKKCHMKPYIYHAESAGYRVAIVFIPHPRPEVAAARSKHSVPIEVINKMLDEWEY